MKASTSINKDNLLHCGTCLGKFTKSGKFRLHITALDYLAQYSKVCLRRILLFYVIVEDHPCNSILHSMASTIYSTKYGSNPQRKCLFSTEIM
jgi:hypothetical protein